MILSKLFSRKQETKMSMTEVLLSNSGSGKEQGLTEKPLAGRIKIDGQSDGHSERPDKSITNPAKENVR